MLARNKESKGLVWNQLIIIKKAQIARRRAAKMDGDNLPGNPGSGTYLLHQEFKQMNRRIVSTLTSLSKEAI